MPDFDDYHLAEDDIGTDVDITCRDSKGVIIDVTNAAPINYFWKHAGVAVVTKVGLVLDGVNGVVRYRTLSADIKGSDLTVEVELTISGKTTTSDPNFFRVKPKLV